MKIGNRPIGKTAPPFITAEIGQAHEGSLSQAHAYIDAIAHAGADAVKFQTHIAAEESTRTEPWRVRFSRLDATRYDYWKRMEFEETQWRELAAHARERGLIFLSSPFSVAAVDMLERIGVPAWKIGAGEITTPDMMARILRSGKPVLLSNGMSTWKELDQIVEKIRSAQSAFAIYQCTSAYPCPAELIGLNILNDLRTRYGCPVGLSDHSGTIYAGLAACALGANMIEVHITLSRESEAPDTAASVTPDELAQLTRGCRYTATVLANPVDKDAVALSLHELRQTFRKKIVASHALPSGHRLLPADIAFKKAAGGRAAETAERCIGRILKKDIQEDDPIDEDCFD